MSAFLVEDKTINKIITCIRQDDYLPPEIQKRMELDIKTKDGAHDFGIKLLKMNLDALAARYGYDDDDGETLKIYQYVLSPATKIETVKAAHCLRYQCSEGRVPEYDLYKLLDYIISALESDIVHALPEYDAAPWG